MPVHGGWHRQLIDQLEIDAIGLGRGVAPLAIELTDAARTTVCPNTVIGAVATSSTTVAALRGR